MDGTRGGAARHMTDSMKEKLGDVAADAARTAVESNLDQAAEAVEDRYGAVLDPVSDATDRVARFVRARPLLAVMLAAAVGFTIGRA